MSETYQTAIGTEEGFGRRLRELRDDRKLTRAKGAEGARISVESWASYERGRTHPTLFNLIRITMVLGLKDDEVIYLVLGDRSE